MELLLIVLLGYILIKILFAAGHTEKRDREEYYQTEYAIQTRNSYEQVVGDNGLLGEFYIYRALAPLEGPRRFLFNLYLPRRNGGTTELDVVLLHESGIYVFESKNYGGWIFGSEQQQYWTQTLPAGRGTSQKHRFYNPMLQNEGHLNRLYQLLRPVQLLNGPPPYYSYIVFSDHCVFKAVPCESRDHHILHLRSLFCAVQENAAEAGIRLTAADIETLYEYLEPYTQVDDTVKQTHIEDIQSKYH